MAGLQQRISNELLPYVQTPGQYIGREFNQIVRDAKEHWPVGWPPKGNPGETLPELFKFLKINIGDAPLSEAITAIAGRVKVPVLYDHNSLARIRADLSTKVSLTETNVFYARALDRLLSQARLRYEIRVDEANKPFLWITTLAR